MADILVIDSEETAVVTKRVESIVEIQQSDLTVVSTDPQRVPSEAGNGVVVTATNDAVVEVQRVETVIVAVGAQGPAGRDGTSSGALEINFAYGDASPAILTTVPAGKLIYRIGLHIKQPFDGVGAALVIGDSTVNDRLMKADENDPTTVGSNETSPAYAYGSDTVVSLTIIPGAGASTGSGLISLFIEQ